MSSELKKEGVSEAITEKNLRRGQWKDVEEGNERRLREKNKSITSNHN